MHRARIAAVAGLGLVGLVWLGAALAQHKGSAATPVDAGGPVATAVSAGKHLRLDGPHGPIHVWIPAGYRAETGATIVYVHGYFNSVDVAWTSHQLPEQAALSGQNAILIAPEAPVQQKVPVNYPDLTELIRFVEDKAGVPRGAALTVAIGHSGAYRTIYEWLDEPMLDQVILVDAMYGDEDTIVEWANASDRHRLIMIGEDTVLGTEAVVSGAVSGAASTGMPVGSPSREHAHVDTHIAITTTRESVGFTGIEVAHTTDRQSDLVWRSARRGRILDDEICPRKFEAVAFRRVTASTSAERRESRLAPASRCDALRMPSLDYPGAICDVAS